MVKLYSGVFMMYPLKVLNKKKYALCFINAFLENICLGKRISNETLSEYLKDAGLDEWINDLENGLDTLVGEKGIKLSAGQKQRLNIIRGILLDKEIYILDEPTSNLDSLSENKIYDMINKYLKDKTCLIVTHRPKLTEICNKHYCFDKRIMLEK